MTARTVANVGSKQKKQETKNGKKKQLHVNFKRQGIVNEMTLTGPMKRTL